jgi:hypothetical protein
LNILPLFTTVISGAFTYSLLKQYQERKKIHQLLWSIAMLFYAVSALMEFLMNRDILGPSVLAFKVYYILSAPLVGLLGAGVVYLLGSKKIANAFTALMVILSLALLVTGATHPLDQSVLVEAFQGPLGEAFHGAVQAFPMSVRMYAIVINIVGGLVLIGGALYSFIRDRRRTYNLWIFLGGLAPMIGGSALAFFHMPDLFFVFECTGTALLYWGFILSDRFIKNREALVQESKEKHGVNPN